MQQTSRLFTVGSILADMRVHVPHLPPRGGDVIGDGASLSAGGGFNILAAAARQGMACVFAGRHGTGPYGDRIRTDLAEEGIAAALPTVAEGDSGFCLVMVEPDGERTFVTAPGVEAELGPRRLDALDLRPGDWLFLSGYDLAYPELGSAIADWVPGLPGGIGLMVDPGPLVMDIPGRVHAAVMPRATVWSMNAREAQMLTGASEPAAVRAAMMPGLAQDALLVLRDGAAGAWVSPHAAGGLIHVPAPAVHMRDSTGAGDSHAGVLIAALAEGVPPRAAVVRANAAAAYSVTQPGPATAPKRDALDAFIAQGGG